MESLYTKYRPQTFEQVVGQKHVVETLKRAVVEGRTSHAYLFCGPRGTGKTTMARLLAKALMCEKGPGQLPDGTCEQCRLIAAGEHPDVAELDAASRTGVDNVREEILSRVNYAPTLGRCKVYIIDEVHMLTTEAFNALLKTLEEPPAHVVFILATTEAHKVPPTIQSRCQRYDFKRITVEEIESRLRYITAEMKMEAEDEALAMIAIQADGGMRDALSILDQCAALAEGTITAERVRQILGLVGHEWIYKMTKALAARNVQEALQILAELLRDGKDLKQVLSELSLHLRSLMIFQAAGTVEAMDLYAEPQDVLQDQAKLFAPEVLPRMIARLHEAMTEMKWSPQPRITVEVALMELCRPELVASTQENAGQAASNGPRAASSNPADEARIAKLEAALAQVTALLKQATAGAGVRPAVAPATGVPTPAPAAPAATPAVTPAPADVPEEPAALDEAGLQVWNQLFQALRDQHKAPILACIQNARFMGMTASQFHMRMQSGLMASLVMRNYRKTIERILQELTGRELRLVCAGEDAPMKAPPRPRPAAPKLAPRRETPPAKPEPTEILEEVAPDERASLKKAFDVFGANVVGVETTKAAPQPAAPEPAGHDIYEDGAIPLPEDGDVPLPTEDDE